MKPITMFWYWVNERMAIYRRREAGDPWPWTRDPILQRYRFCMPSRDFDKMTIELRRHTEKKKTDFDKVFTVFVFRYFNRSSTFDKIASYITPWDARRIRAILRSIDGSVMTGVWMVPGLIKGAPVWAGSVRALDAIHTDIRLITAALRGVTLKEAFYVIRNQPMAGNFLAYQLAQDVFRCTTLLSDDENFVQIGPGAQRGLALLSNVDIARLIDDGAKKIIDVELRDRWCISDVEHSLCEFAKYERAARGAHLRNLYKSEVAHV